MAARKRRSFLFDFDDDFERIREEMERMMEEAFKVSEPEVTEEPGSRIIRKGPFVYGFSMRMGKDGKPVVEEFGNVKQRIKGEGEEREPLVDVIEETDKVTVIVELPGVTREDIQLNATDESLAVRVNTAERKYQKTIKLPVEVKPETAKASYKNGVLEVKIERKTPKPQAKGAKIKIE